MKTLAAILVALPFAMVGCDGRDDIRLRFAVHPGAVAPTKTTVGVYWLHQYKGETLYAGRIVSKREVTGPEFVEVAGICCGESHDYHHDNLWFIACIDGAQPTLVCGRPGATEAQLVRAPAGQSCDTIDVEIETHDVDLAKCTLTPQKAAR